MLGQPCAAQQPAGEKQDVAEAPHTTGDVEKG